VDGRERDLRLREMGPKAKSVLIKLASSAGTGFYYTTRRNPTKSTQSKLALRKYDPIIRQHVLFTESKLASGKKRT